MLQLQKFVRGRVCVCNKLNQQPWILPVQIVVLCISSTDFATKLEGYHNTCITSFTELWTKTWNLFPCYRWKYLSISYEEDLRNCTNTDTTNFTSASEKGRTIRETYALKQNWPNARPWLQYLPWVCGYKSFRFSFRFKISQHPAAAFFQSFVKGWTRWVPRMKNIHPSQASSCCFSRKFCSGKGFTDIWQGLGGGKCCGNPGGGRREDGGCPPGDRTSHHISWILAHHMLSFLEYLCRSVMRGTSMCWVFLRTWLYLREMSSGKSKTLHNGLSESMPHKTTRLTDYRQVRLLLLHSDNYRSLHYSWQCFILSLQIFCPDKEVSHL